jgi:hypothetical protein
MVVKPLCVLGFNIVVHNTYCVVLLFCFCSSYVPNFASFSSFSFFISPSVFSNEYYVNDKKNTWYMIATYIKSKIMLCLSPARTCKRCLSYLICLFYYCVGFLAIYWFILDIIWYIVGDHASLDIGISPSIYLSCKTHSLASCGDS